MSEQLLLTEERPCMTLEQQDCEVVNMPTSTNSSDGIETVCESTSLSNESANTLTVKELDCDPGAVVSGVSKCETVKLSDQVGTCHTCAEVDQSCSETNTDPSTNLMSASSADLRTGCRVNKDRALINDHNEDIGASLPTTGSALVPDCADTDTTQMAKELSAADKLKVDDAEKSDDVTASCCPEADTSSVVVESVDEAGKACSQSDYNIDDSSRTGVASKTGDVTGQVDDAVTSPLMYSDVDSASVTYTADQLSSSGSCPADDDVSGPKDNPVSVNQSESGERAGLPGNASGFLDETTHGAFSPLRDGSPHVDSGSDCLESSQTDRVDLPGKASEFLDETFTDAFFPLKGATLQVDNGVDGLDSSETEGIGLPGKTSEFLDGTTSGAISPLNGETFHVDNGCLELSKTDRVDLAGKASEFLDETMTGAILPSKGGTLNLDNSSDCLQLSQTDRVDLSGKASELLDETVTDAISPRKGGSPHIDSATDCLDSSQNDRLDLPGKASEFLDETTSGAFSPPRGATLHVDNGTDCPALSQSNNERLDAAADVVSMETTGHFAEPDCTDDGSDDVIRNCPVGNDRSVDVGKYCFLATVHQCDDEDPEMEELPDGLKSGNLDQSDPDGGGEIHTSGNNSHNEEDDHDDPRMEELPDGSRSGNLDQTVPDGDASGYNSCNDGDNDDDDDTLSDDSAFNDSQTLSSEEHCVDNITLCAAAVGHLHQVVEDFQLIPCTTVMSEDFTISQPRPRSGSQILTSQSSVNQEMNFTQRQTIGEPLDIDTKLSHASREDDHMDDIGTRSAPAEHDNTCTITCTANTCLVPITCAASPEKGQAGNCIREALDIDTNSSLAGADDVGTRSAPAELENTSTSTHTANTSLVPANTCLVPITCTASPEKGQASGCIHDSSAVTLDHPDDREFVVEEDIEHRSGMDVLASVCESLVNVDTEAGVQGSTRVTGELSVDEVGDGDNHLEKPDDMIAKKFAGDAAVSNDVGSTKDHLQISDVVSGERDVSERGFSGDHSKSDDTNSTLREKQHFDQSAPEMYQEYIDANSDGELPETSPDCDENDDDQTRKNLVLPYSSAAVVIAVAAAAVDDDDDEYATSSDMSSELHGFSTGYETNTDSSDDSSNLGDYDSDEGGDADDTITDDSGDTDSEITLYSDEDLGFDDAGKFNGIAQPNSQCPGDQNGGHSTLCRATREDSENIQLAINSAQRNTEYIEHIELQIQQESFATVPDTDNTECPEPSKEVSADCVPQAADGSKTCTSGRQYVQLGIVEGCSREFWWQGGVPEDPECVEDKDELQVPCDDDNYNSADGTDVSSDDDSDDGRSVGDFKVAVADCSESVNSSPGKTLHTKPNNADINMTHVTASVIDYHTTSEVAADPPSNTRPTVPVTSRLDHHEPRKRGGGGQVETFGIEDRDVHDLYRTSEDEVFYTDCEEQQEVKIVELGAIFMPPVETDLSTTSFSSCVADERPEDEEHLEGRCDERSAGVMSTAGLITATECHSVVPQMEHIQIAINSIHGSTERIGDVEPQAQKESFAINPNLNPVHSHAVTAAASDDDVVPIIDADTTTTGRDPHVARPVIMNEDSILADSRHDACHHTHPAGISDKMGKSGNSECKEVGNSQDASFAVPVLNSASDCDARTSIPTSLDQSTGHLQPTDQLKLVEGSSDLRSPRLPPSTDQLDREETYTEDVPYDRQVLDDVTGTSGYLVLLEHGYHSNQQPAAVAVTSMASGSVATSVANDNTDQLDYCNALSTADAESRKQLNPETMMTSRVMMSSGDQTVDESVDNISSEEHLYSAHHQSPPSTSTS